MKKLKINDGNAFRARKFKRFRKKHKVSLRQVAAISGYANTYWCMLENNQRNWDTELENIYLQSIARARELRDQKVVDRLEAA